MVDKVRWIDGAWEMKKLLGLFNEVIGNTVHGLNQTPTQVPGTTLENCMLTRRKWESCLSRNAEQ